MSKDIEITLTMEWDEDWPGWGGTGRAKVWEPAYSSTGQATGARQSNYETMCDPRSSSDPMPQIWQMVDDLAMKADTHPSRIGKVVVEFLGPEIRRSVSKA